MINQLRLTKQFIDHLENLSSAAQIGIEHLDDGIENKPDVYFGSVKSIIEDSNESYKQSIAVIEDFIHRATHNDRGEPLK